GCLPIYNPNLPISKTISVKLNQLSEPKYEIAYYFDYGNKFNIHKGRKFPDYQNGDTIVGRLADPYGDSVGTQFSQPVVLDDPDRCIINLKVVIYRRRCYLSTELMMSDTSFLPYNNVINIFFNGTRPGSIAYTNLGNNLRNQQEWAVLDTDLQTMTFKKVTWHKIIPYGDTVFLQNLLLLNDRGFKSGSWYGENGYTNTPVNNNILTLNMIENKKTEYILNSDFVLLKIKTIRVDDIGLTYNIINGYPFTSRYPVKTRDNASFTYVYLNTELSTRPPYSHYHDDNHSEEDNYKYKTAKIKFYFSKPVCESSLTDDYPMSDDFIEIPPGGVNYEYEGLYGHDLNPGMGILGTRCTVGEEPVFPRFDGQPLKNYYYDTEKGCTTNENIVTMTFVSPLGFGLPHMSDFKIHVGSHIQTFPPTAIKKSKSADNILSYCWGNLSNPGDAQFFTRYPNIEVRLKDCFWPMNPQNLIILSFATFLKNDDYIRKNPQYILGNNNFQGNKLPPVGCYPQFPPDLKDDYTSDLLNYHTFKQGRWNITLDLIRLLDNYDQSFDYTKIFTETKKSLLDYEIQNLSDHLWHFAEHHIIGFYRYFLNV
ncbi:MAG: hypothetical protein M1419_06915, partial [Bacteroidetes bacterium]|nr:hypothetical protein [Bacteroidota bacterium]